MIEQTVELHLDGNPDHVFGVAAMLHGPRVERIVAVEPAATLGTVIRYQRWVAALFTDALPREVRVRMLLRTEPGTVRVLRAGPLAGEWVEPAPSPLGRPWPATAHSSALSTTRIERLLFNLTVCSVRAASDLPPADCPSEVARAAQLFWQIDASTACPLYLRFWERAGISHRAPGPWRDDLDAVFRTVARTLAARWRDPAAVVGGQVPTQSAASVAGQLLRIFRCCVPDLALPDLAACANRFASGGMGMRADLASVVRDQFLSNGGPDGPAFPLFAEMALLAREVMPAEADAWSNIAAAMIGSLHAYQHAWGTPGTPQPYGNYVARHRAPPAAPGPPGAVPDRSELEEALHRALRKLFSEAPAGLPPPPCPRLGEGG